MRATEQLVQVYHHGDLVKTHVRTDRGRVTDFEDYPPEKIAFHRGTPARCRQTAEDIGAAASAVVTGLLEGSAQYQLRSAQAILALREKHGPARLEAACAKAIETGDPAYRTIRKSWPPAWKPQTCPSAPAATAEHPPFCTDPTSCSAMSSTCRNAATRPGRDRRVRTLGSTRPGQPAAADRDAPRFQRRRGRRTHAVPASQPSRPRRLGVSDHAQLREAVDRLIAIPATKDETPRPCYAPAWPQASRPSNSPVCSRPSTPAWPRPTAAAWGTWSSCRSLCDDEISRREAQSMHRRLRRPRAPQDWYAQFPTPSSQNPYSTGSSTPATRYS